MSCSLRWVLFLFGLLPVVVAAQQPTAASRTSRRIPRDTTPLLYSFALTPERSQPVGDTLPDHNFRMYDPARRQPVDWGTLGNLGSSARPLFFDTRMRRGFDLGSHSFDLYRLKANDLRFYRNTRSYSEAFFSQGRTQFDGTLNARFGRTFAGGTNLSLDYRTINNKGQYLYQRDKHNTLGIGLWVPLGTRYDGFVIFCNNINRQQDNGGIVTDTVFGSGDLSGPAAAAIRLPDENALTRGADQTLQLTQHLKFIGLGDSSASKRVLRATHTLAWVRESYKFSDTPLDDDLAFFDTFGVDFRGLRNYIQMQRLDNTLMLSTFKAKNKGRPSDMLSVGLRHSWFNVYQEPEETSFSNLFLTGELAFTPSERFGFTAQGDLGVLKNLGEYVVRGDLVLGLGRAGQLRGSLLSQRYPPSLLSQRLFISKQLFWANSFEKPVENTLSATYALPWAGLEVTARTQLVNNYLYFDQRGLAQQASAAVQVGQLLATEHLRLGNMRLDGTVAVQQINRTDVIRLPKWFVKSSLYYSGKIFHKRLHLEAGADLRVNSEFRPDGYQPLTGQFHLQDTLSQPPFVWLDAFAAFKVQSFRFFFRYENIATFWDKKSVFYQTARHPLPFGGIRLGIAWRFMDNNAEDKTEEPSSPNDSSRPPGSTIGPRG